MTTANFSEGTKKEEERENKHLFVMHSFAAIEEKKEKV